jgi:hypothetical protein
MSDFSSRQAAPPAADPPSPPRAYLLPPGRIARRAREWRLYDETGARYADFWQADGSAFLGHRPRGLGRLVEAEIDRGLWAALPTAWPRRLEKALERLAATAGVASLTPVNGTAAARRAGDDRWLPLATPSMREGLTVVVPAPGVHVSSNRDFREMPTIAVAALTRMTLALAGYIGGDEAAARRELAAGLEVPPHRRLEGAWLVPTEVGGDVGAAGETDAHGDAEWDRLRLTAAERGILLPPDRWTPIAVPGEINRAEREAWKGLVDEWTC